MEHEIIALSGDAVKKETKAQSGILKKLITSAECLDSPEHCLMVAMLNHVGMSKQMPVSQEKFRFMYLKFLILTKNDPEEKAHYMALVKDQVTLLTGNKKEDTTLDADMKKLDEFFVKYLADNNLDSIEGNVEKNLTDIVSGFRKLTSSVKSVARGGGDANMGIRSGLLLVDLAMICKNKMGGRR